jgi:hypothetical protein
MHDIISVQPGFHKLICPESESKRLRKTHSGDPDPFNEIDRIQEFLKGRDSEGILGIVEIKAGQLIHWYIIVQLRIGGT